MNLKVSHLLPGLIALSKPGGLATHSSTPQNPGVVEIISTKAEKVLYPCHRLDKETSGALLLPESASRSSQLTELFSSRQVKKGYLFLTDRKTSFTRKEHASFIQREKGRYVSQTSKEHNATTHFTKLRGSKNSEVWKAEPLTGKTHQIRLHARDLGMPIIGDSLYGGGEFPFLLLHAHTVQFELDGQTITYQAPPPAIFETPSDLEDNPFATKLSLGLFRRRCWVEWTTQECIRLLHNEIPEVCCDKLGEVAWFYWYGERTPTSREIKDLSRFAEEAGCHHWKISLMHNKGGSSSPVLPKLQSENCPVEWCGIEEGITYVFRREQGSSAGLFLDQRENRSYVRQHAAGKQILNLFCYTAGFSVAAALGGATSITSVDTSKNTLEWAKENFKQNGLLPEKFRFIHEDARDYLKRAIKRGEHYDIIVVDPPSFARNKKGIFSFAKDYIPLVEQCLSLLTERGFVIASTNYEKIPFSDFLTLLKNHSERFGRKVTPLHLPLDFALGTTEPLMKSALIS
jgi:23S rRNA (cytosine1962-C5)-methyltransferase